MVFEKRALVIPPSTMNKRVFDSAFAMMDNALKLKRQNMAVTPADTTIDYMYDWDASRDAVQRAKHRQKFAALRFGPTCTCTARGFLSDFGVDDEPELYDPEKTAYDPAEAVYDPSAPRYRLPLRSSPTSPNYSPYSPAYSPTSPAYTPTGWMHSPASSNAMDIE